MKHSLLSQSPCDSSRARDYIAERGCIVRLLGLEDAFGACVGVVSVHHEPFRSQGGDDTNIVGGLCELRHHRMRHDEHPEFTAFIIEHREELTSLSIGAYLTFIEQSNGLAPEPKQKQHKSTRKNRTAWDESPKKFTPIEKRTDLGG